MQWHVPALAALLIATATGIAGYKAQVLGYPITPEASIDTWLVEAKLSFEAVPETLRRTNLGALDVGSPVDLERAVPGERPMGGHYVQGHVDATITVRSVAPDGEAVEMWFDAPPALLKYVVPKGYVTVDGASLTVVGTDASGFSVTLVPHTQGNVVFGAAAPGYVANFEVDVMAKYVERIVGPRLEALERRLAAFERESSGDASR